MAVTLTIPELLSALRMGGSTEETAEAQRLLGYSSQAISDYLGTAYEGTPASVVNEAAIRLSGHLFDQPYASRGTGFAASLANSGAGAILLPYRIARAGSVSEAASLAVQSGTAGNPVVQISIVGNDLVVEYADASTADVELPAAISQGNAVVNLSLSGTLLTVTHVDGSEEQIDLPTTGGGGPGVDQTARDWASNAQADADAAQAEIGAHERAPHNNDQTARDSAAAAQGAIADHERAPHNTDGTARTEAAAAQTTADDAFALADGKVDSSGATSAAREVTSDWAEAENTDPIPAPKLALVVNAHEDIVNVLDGRLPGLPVAMRLGWSQTRTFTELDFDRPLPPIGGSIAGLSDGIAAPPFPPGLASDPTLFFGVWLEGDPDIVEISGGGARFGNKRPLTIDDGKVGGNPGVYRVSTARLSPLEGTIFSVTITGPRLVLERELFAHESDPDAHHVPPDTGGGGPGEDATARAAAATAQTAADTAQAEIDTHVASPHNTDQTARDAAAAAQMAAEAAAGGRPTVLFEAASAAIGGSTGLIPGNVVCPENGALEFYFEGLTGTRQGGVAYARIPAERVRGAVSAVNVTYSNDTSNMLLISHGANRGFAVAIQATSNFLLLAAQAPGNFYCRISHSLVGI